MIGEHVVWLAVEGAEDPVNLSCFVDELTIQHGREDTDSQPEAATVTIDMSWDTDDATLPPVEIGATVAVVTRLGVTDYVRFVGKVSDITVGWDDAGEGTPDRPVAQVIAAATLADLGRRVVGAAPFPQQLDGARVAAVMAAAGVVLDPLYSDPGTVDVLPRDIDSQPALEVAQEPAVSARGTVWHTRAGEVRYADSDHRRNLAASLTLDACDVLVTPTWSRTTAALINSVSLGYGPTPEQGEQPRVVDSNATSIDRFGEYEYTAATVLAELADAEALARLLLVRNAYPVWVMTALPVEVKNLSPEDTAALLSLDMHALVELTGLPSAAGAPTSSFLWVEGWTEKLAWGEHELELQVSGYCRTAPAPRWDDMPLATTWDTVAGTWDTATCMGPPTTTGRWSDVSAALRWDQATTTWDTWEG